MPMAPLGRAKNVLLPVQKCWPAVKKSAVQDFMCPRLLSLVHGQVGWVPRLPAAGAGRKADPAIIAAFPGSPALSAGSFTLIHEFQQVLSEYPRTSREAEVFWGIRSLSPFPPVSSISPSNTASAPGETTSKSREDD